MSRNTKIAVWVVAAIVVVGGGAWWWMGMGNSGISQVPTNPAPQTAMVGGNTNTTPSSTPQGNGISMTDNSNAALQADLSNIDSQMNGFSSDNASVNQGLNDQPVSQQ